MRDALGVALPVGHRRRPTSSRSPTRSATWSPATPARTGRSPPPPARPGSGSACSWSSRRCTGSPPPGGWSPASSRPTAPAPSGATPRCCACCAAGRWPRCAARSSRCRPAPWPRSCPAGSTSARRRAASRRSPRPIEQLQGVAVPASALERLVLPGPGRRLLARLPRRAVRQRRGGLGRRRLDRRRRRLGHPGLRRHRPAAAAAARRGAGAHPAARVGARRARRRAGAVLPLAVRPVSAPPTTPRWSPRCGTWSGPAGSPTTPSRRCAPCSAAAGRTGRGPARRAPATGGPAGRGGSPCRRAPARRPSPAAGHGCPSATPTRPGGRPRWPTRCWNGTAWSPGARSRPRG